MIHDVGKLTQLVDERARTQAEDRRVCIPLSTLPGTQGNSGGLILAHLPEQQVSQAHCWGFLVSSGLSWCFEIDSFLFS
jgi:hypothetical protein